MDFFDDNYRAVDLTVSGAGDDDGWHYDLYECERCFALTRYIASHEAWHAGERP